MVTGQGRQYVALLIDPSTGEIEAYGPADELNAVLLAEELRHIAPGSRYPIHITHTKPAETELIADEIRRMGLEAPRDIRWLSAGQVFEV